MKVGFLSQSLMNTEKYWNKLQDKADCWWGVIHREFYDELRARNHTKIVFHNERRRLDENKKLGNPFVPINPGESENIVAREIDPDLWISETLNKLSFVPKKALWVQIFHAMPMKKHFFYHPVLEYDLMLLPGEYHKNELVKRFDMDPDDERLKIVGWPGTDDFFNGTFDRNEIMNDLGLDPDRKTLMYAPTWGWSGVNKMMFARDLGGEEIEVFEKLCRRVKEMKLNFIVKLHCLAIHASNKEMIEIADKYGVLWVTKETSCFQADPYPFMWITDILLSDVSGVITEFLTLDRPIIYIDPDEKINAWNGSDMPPSFRMGHVIQTLDELTDAIDDSIRRPERFSEQRRDLTRKIIHAPDGRAADRAVDEILKFAESKQLLQKVS